MKDKVEDDSVKINKLFDLACHWTANEKYQLAIQCYTEILELDPANKIAKDERLICYSLAGAHDLAISSCIDLLKSDKAIAINYYKLGYALFMNKDYTNAIRSLNNAIQLEANYCDALAQRGTAYFMLGDYKKAVSDFQKASLLDQYDHNLHSQIGECNRVIGNFDQAIKYFTKSIELIFIDIETGENDFNESINPLLEVHSLRAEAWEDKGEATGDKSSLIQARADYQFILDNPASNQDLIEHSQERLVYIEKVLSGENLQPSKS
jgi:tetratricopeptide (TPR) repeat protein